MESWEVAFAGELKKRDNPQPIGACLGEILAVGDDWKVAIQNGQFIIDKSNGYICQHILGRPSSYTATQSQSGSISAGCPLSAHSGSGYNASGTISGHIELSFIDYWRPGNKVKVTPDASGQKFFIDDIVLGGD